MRWGFLSVTDLVAQSWCEQKLVYSYFPPTPEYELLPLEEIAPAVAAGQEIHQVRLAISFCLCNWVSLRRPFVSLAVAFGGRDIKLAFRSQWRVRPSVHHLLDDGRFCLYRLSCSHRSDPFFHCAKERDMELGEKVVIETETKEDRVALQFAQLLEVGGVFKGDG